MWHWRCWVFRIAGSLLCSGLTLTTATDTDSTVSVPVPVSVVIHRNGEADSCGSVLLFLDLLAANTQQSKYHVEHLLTQWIAQALSTHECAPSPPTGSTRTTGTGSNSNTTHMGLYQYCDMGPERTPILWDHPYRERVHHHQHPNTTFLPCRWHTQNGQRITSFTQLTASTTSCSTTAQHNNHNQIHLYAVPTGRLFQFAPSYVGQVFDLSYIMDTTGTTSSPPTSHHNDHPRHTPPITITLTVLSVSPRIFDIHHLFTTEQAQALVTRALEETSPSHKLTRSTTGTLTWDTNSRRTSETAFDPQGAVAVTLKQKILQVLGMDVDGDVDGDHHKEWKGHDDGIQILRYNQTTAYAPHLDYLYDSPATSFNFDSARKGGNRFATVLLYLSDVPLGGETVFTQTVPTHTVEDALADLRASGEAKQAGIELGSWEEQMVADCRRYLAIPPKQGRAVLFYSQHPNGEVDHSSLHGGCPVLQGEKWAANLWVWNTPRRDHPGAPQKEGHGDDATGDPRAGKRLTATNVPAQLSATFTNSGIDPAVRVAELWYDEGLYWGPLGHGDPPLQFNTYQGHRWNIRVDGNVVKKFVIGNDKHQEFII